MSSHAFRSVVLLTVMAFVIPSVAQARAPKKYQVTGKVVELTDDVIVVLNKDDEKWEIGRDKSTKVDGKLKVGEKVTIQYTMSAASVEVKDDKATAAPEQKPAPSKKPANAPR